MKFLSSIFLIFCIFFVSNQLESVIIAKQIEIQFSVEDGDKKGGVVKEASFDQMSIDLSKKSFMNRIVTNKFERSAGNYEITWVTEKADTPWDEKKVEKHKRLIILELSDAVIYVNIRGDQFRVY